uniref:Putative phosphatidylglycerol/phosphatidylinositol transfer protein DDB_G0282179 isoform X2 n=1 Tax=Rhizophora mucronata TaxID=61149 RepID=A0A2P2JV73_RHIMU
MQSMESLPKSSWSKQTHLLFIATCLLLPSVLSTDVKYCDKEANYAVKVYGVDISPNPVVTGEPATFNISGSTGQTLSGGKVVIDVSYFSIHVHRETHDLCDEICCPVAVGSFVLSHTQRLPGYTPPGSYTLKMTMKDNDNEELTCIRFKFNIGFGSLVSDT